MVSRLSDRKISVTLKLKQMSVAIFLIDVLEVKIESCCLGSQLLVEVEHPLGIHSNKESI